MARSHQHCTTGTVWADLPEPFDPWSLGLPRNEVPYAARFVGDVCLRLTYDPDLLPGGYTPMWSKITEKWMPRGRRLPIINALVRSGVLRRNDKYWAGGPTAQSIGYGLAEPYWGERYRPRRLRPWAFDCPELARRVRGEAGSEHAGRA